MKSIEYILVKLKASSVLFTLHFSLLTFFITMGVDYMNILNTNLIIKTTISLGIILFCKMISSSFSYILIKVFNLKKDKNKIKNNAFYKPIKTFVTILGIYLSTLLFIIPVNIKVIIIKAFKICTIVLISKGFANLFNTNTESFSKLKEKLNFKENDGLVNFTSKILKCLVYIIAGFIIISELGYDLGGLVTGLGITSVVVALAAQDLAKSLLSGLCILLDKPFNIGDYITVNNYEGTVEDITFRTTRIRDIANDVIVIPNSQIAENNIVNYSRKDSRFYSLLLTFELSTSLDKVAGFKEKLMLLLNLHEHVLNENIRVFFHTISDNGISVKITFYTDVVNYGDFLKFKEEMNFSILDLVQKTGIELAYDSKTIYLKNN